MRGSFMINSSKFGFTLQSYICRFYGLELNPRLEKQADFSYLSINTSFLESLRVQIFNGIDAKPIKLTTFDKLAGTETGLTPYNFILSNGKTLSIHTSSTSDKVAPKIVGQGGYKTLTDYFGEIYGGPIENHDDIKRLICRHISEILPTFIDNVFTSDYLVFVNWKTKKVLSFDADDYPDLDLVPSNFRFSKSESEWNWSNSLFYKEKFLAEIQIPITRTIIFRFVIDSLVELLNEKKKNNESLGISAEEEVCEIFGLDDKGIKPRAIKSFQRSLHPILLKAFSGLPKPIEYTGSDKGNRGGESKCSYDFVLEGGKTLSLKTNIGKMVCPPEVGQPSAKTFTYYFSDLLDGEIVTPHLFKQMTYEHTIIMISRYLEHLFDSDYLLRIFEDNKHQFQYEIVNKDYGSKVTLDQSQISFSKENEKEWNESNTLYYKKNRLGEFQVHKHRDCYKFRFDFENLLKLIDDFERDLNKSK